MSDNLRYDDLEHRLDIALDALAAELPPPDDDDAEYLELLDMARIARTLRDPDIPDEGFASQLAAQLQPYMRGESQNGLTTGHHMTPLRIVRTRQSRKRWLFLSIAALLRTLGAGVIAGAIAGLLAIGVGGRIAMRISGALFTREHPGVTTVTDSSGQTIGVISLTGTLDLFAQSMFAGLVGGLVYIAIRQWLPAARRARMVTNGAFMLCTLGLLFIDRDNSDFSRIGIPWLNVAMFAIFVAGFGLLVSPLSEGLLERSGARTPGESSQVRAALRAIVIYPAGGLGLLLLGILTFSAFVWIVAASFEFVTGRGNRLELAAIIAASVLILTLPFLNYASREVAGAAPTEGLQIRIHAHRQAFNRAGQFLLIVTSTVGLLLLLYTILVILTA